MDQALSESCRDRAVVHHILVFTDSPGGSAQDFGGGVRGFLAGYVPECGAAMLPDGMAKRIPAGSKLVFQVHYTPVGSVQHDRSKIGFVFADPEEVKREVKTIGVFQPRIRIPANANNHREVTKLRIAEPVQLLGLTVHMHLRGKSFRYQVKLPGEADWTTVLDIPKYDFNWQTNYQLAEPLKSAGGYVHQMHRCLRQFRGKPQQPGPQQKCPLGGPNMGRDADWLP